MIFTEATPDHQNVRLQGLRALGYGNYAVCYVLDGPGKGCPHGSVSPSKQSMYRHDRNFRVAAAGDAYISVEENVIYVREVSVIGKCPIIM